MKRMKRRNLPEIELTPLIDVLFILIIFFVLTTSFIRNQVNVDLPGGTGSPVKGKPAVIAVTEEGRYMIKGVNSRSSISRITPYKRKKMSLLWVTETAITA